MGWVRDGMRVGRGTGSTAAPFITLLGQRVREGGLRIEATATSRASEELARQVGIPLLEPRRGLRFDLTVDGADEFDAQLRLIKGGGGALLREKVIATASDYLLIVADSTKAVGQLGRFPLPLEVVPFPGMVEHGLFLGLASAALVAQGGQVQVWRPGQAPVAANAFTALP